MGRVAGAKGLRAEIPFCRCSTKIKFYYSIVFSREILWSFGLFLQFVVPWVIWAIFILRTVLEVLCFLVVHALVRPCVLNCMAECHQIHNLRVLGDKVEKIRFSDQKTKVKVVTRPNIYCWAILSAQDV